MAPRYQLTPRLIRAIPAFIRAGGKRPLMRPRAGRWNDTRGGGGAGDDTA